MDKKITDITGHPRHPSKHAQGGESPMDEDDLPDIDNSMFWPEPTDENTAECMAMLHGERIAVIVVKGCFGLYHLVREHKGRRAPVPKYLLEFREPARYR